VQAKAVMHRDLEELRAKRLAAENPPTPEIIPTPVEEELPEVKEEAVVTPEVHHTTFKQEKVAPEAPMIVQDIPKDAILNGPATKGPQGPSPPSSNDVKQEPNSLGLVTGTTASNDMSPTATSGLPGSAIDSLFGTTESLDNAADADLNFDTMDFIDNSNTHDNSQTQNTEFDLSTFGNNPSEFNMTEIQGSNEPESTNNNATTIQDDLFGMTTAGGNDLMDLDATMRPVEESSFDDLFFMGDDSGIGGGGSNEMEHGPFDDEFFNLS